MSGLSQREVLLGVSGGVACYKAASLARAFVKRGASVQVIMTSSATRFVQPAQFEALTGKRCYVDTFTDPHQIVHVDVARRADVAVFAPATTNLIAKFAAGIADDVVSSTFTALTVPIVVAPAMHTEMWQHWATQNAVAVLQSNGVHIVGPGTGQLAGGDVGPGRLEDEPVIIAAVETALAGNASAVTTIGECKGTGEGAGPPSLAQKDRQSDPLWEGKRVLVTAGGTRERLDPVRFFSNRSTGKMGYEIAKAAQRRGADVVLVAAPTALDDPEGVTVRHVESALDMHAAVNAEVVDADVVIKAAAVADFRPERIAPSKLKKSVWAEDGAPTVRLVANPDILTEIGARDDVDAILVGFAAETDNVEENGVAKLTAKGLDMIVVNDVSATDAGFGTDTNRVIVFHRGGERVPLPFGTKTDVADGVLDQIATLFAVE